MTARGLHRGLALGLGLFLALHLANHLAGLAGQDAHGQVQDALRQVYRARPVEALLLAVLLLQAGLGLWLLSRRRRWGVQTVSGAYLALFLTIHLGAVMVARWQGIETDLAFAAAGLHAPAPWPVVFAPYYGLAVLALFLHLSVPLGRRHPALGGTVAGVGAAVALLLVALLAGLVTPLTIPPDLVAAFPALLHP
jgi:hypothetical protein